MTLKPSPGPRFTFPEPVTLLDPTCCNGCPKLRWHGVTACSCSAILASSNIGKPDSKTKITWVPRLPECRLVEEPKP